MDMYLVIPHQPVFGSLSQATGQPAGRFFDVAQRVHHQIQQFITALHAGIADRSFRLRPDIFFRVEFRRIGRKPLHAQPPMTTAKRNHFPIPMNRAAVQERDHRPAQMPQQLSQVSHHVGRRRVPRVNLKIQTQAFAPRRDAQAADDRQSLPPVTVPQHRRLTHWRPSAQHRRNEQKSALINENQMRAQSPGFFLYAASRVASTPGFSGDCVGGRDVRAFGNSSPGPRAFSKRAPDDRRCPNAGGFARRPGRWSTFRCDNPPLARLVSARQPMLASGQASVPAGGPAWAGASSQPGLCGGMPASSARASLSRIERFGPRFDRSDPVSRATPLFCGALPIVGQCLRVSRTQPYHVSQNISIIYASVNKNVNNLLLTDLQMCA